MSNKVSRKENGGRVYVTRKAVMEYCHNMFSGGYEVVDISKLTGIPETTVRRWIKKVAFDEYERRIKEKKEKVEKLMRIAKIAAAVIDPDFSNPSFEKRVQALAPELTTRERRRVRVLARRELAAVGEGYYARKAQNREKFRRQIIAGATFKSLGGPTGKSKSTLSWIMRHHELDDSVRDANERILGRRSRRGEYRSRQPASQQTAPAIQPGSVEEHAVIAEISVILGTHRPSYRVHDTRSNATEDVWIIVPNGTRNVMLALQVRKINYKNGSPTARVCKNGGKKSYSADDCQLFIACDMSTRDFYCVSTDRVHQNKYSVRCYPEEGFSKDDPDAFLRELDRVNEIGDMSSVSLPEA